MIIDDNLLVNASGLCHDMGEGGAYEETMQSSYSGAVS